MKVRTKKRKSRIEPLELRLSGMSNLPMSLRAAAADYRIVDPRRMSATKRRSVEKANPGVDLVAAWVSDVEHTIKCKGLDEDTASSFRAACGTSS